MGYVSFREGKLLANEPNIGLLYPIIGIYRVYYRVYCRVYSGVRYRVLYQ